MTQLRKNLIGAAIGVVVGIVGGVTVYETWVEADDARAAQGEVALEFDVNIHFTSVDPEADAPDRGEACYWLEAIYPDDRPAGYTHLGIDDSVVIRDATGAIVALAPLRGIMGNPTERTAACVIPVDVAVPPSDAYTVDLADIRLLTTNASSLMTTGAERPGIWYPVNPAG